MSAFSEPQPMINSADYSLIDDTVGSISPKTEGQQMFMQVVELLRLEREVRIFGEKGDDD